MMRLAGLLAFVFLALFARPALAGPASAAPAEVRVRLATSAGDIVIALAMKRAPITAANFLAYVDSRRFDGTSFYRAARTRNAPERGLIQGGIDHRYKLMFLPIRHEPTSETGLSHVSGTISMARGQPGTAMGDFFITVGDITGLDARPADNQPGYAAFGRIVSGMPVVRRILAMPTLPNAGRGSMKGQLLAQRVAIISARRIP